jgi:hypothetical protein
MSTLNELLSQNPEWGNIPFAVRANGALALSSEITFKACPSSLGHSVSHPTMNKVLILDCFVPSALTSKKRGCMMHP